MTLTFTILGCGFSGGVPRPGFGWGACNPDNPKNRRRRCSLLVEQEGQLGGRQVGVQAQQATNQRSRQEHAQGAARTPSGKNGSVPMPHPAWRGRGLRSDR